MHLLMIRIVLGEFGAKLAPGALDLALISAHTRWLHFRLCQPLQSMY